MMLAAEPPSVLAAVDVSPASVEIRQHRQPYALQVLGTSSDGFSVDLRSDAKFASADPKIAMIGATT